MNQTHTREAFFHDHWAEAASVEQTRVRESFEAPTSLEVKYILNELGSLKGLRILDAGAGLGEASVYFALQGAEVVATDLSPAMAEFQQKLATHHGVKISSHVGPAENLSLAGQFDIVYAANLIHHLVDKGAFISAAHRLLAPGGKFVSWDPIRYNPAIFIYRKIAHKVRTADERPLGLGDLRLLQEFFPESYCNFFWLLAQALFVKYFLYDRAHPNNVRYWKRIYEETPATLKWWRPLAWMDQRVLLRLPAMRWLAWNVVFIGRKS
jgi:2-polyprenyl-3-methyl-5-hydroxy-6-metoxy-1,4-benzoquinol methylase